MICTRLTKLARATLFSLCLGAASLGLAPAVARADDTAAQESFRLATQAYEKGDFRGAALSFEKAFRDAPHGSPMYNAGLAWEAGKEPARAADDYELALETPGLTPHQTADAKARLAALDKQVGRLEVNGPTGTTVTVAHVTAGNVPVRLHTAPGEQELVVKSPDGQESRQRVVVPAGGVVPVTLAPPGPAQAPPEAGAPVEAAPPSDEPSPGRTRKTLGWVAVGGGAVLGGVGVYLGVSALDARDEFNASGRQSQDAHDRAGSLRTWTNVVLLGAVALAVTGVVLIVTAPKAPAAEAPGTSAPKKASRGPSPALGVGSLSLTF